MEGSSIWIFMTSVAVAAIALGWAGVSAATAVLNPVRRRLKALQGEGTSGVAATSAVTGGKTGFWQVLEPGNAAERSGVQMKLVRAGFRSSGAVGFFFAAKLILAIVLPIVVIVGLPLIPNFNPPLIGKIAFALVGLLIGFLIPDIVLTRRFESRKTRLMEGLPDALDLLVTCTEAGLGLNAALERVVEQMPASHPELATELSLVNAEVRAGIERNVALRNLGDRTGLEEIHGLVSLIAHSTRLGTGVAATLRIYAEDFRDRRMQRAEELAAMIGTKMIFPLVVCFFPGFFVVALAPGIMNIVKLLSGQ